MDNVQKVNHCLNRPEALCLKVITSVMCTRGSTPILCENRRPEVRRKLKWPYLKCCDGGDLCNSAVMPTPPSWVGGSIGTNEMGEGTNDTQQQRKFCPPIDRVPLGSSDGAVIVPCRVSRRSCIELRDVVG
jgi:hypothetical protein